ncbi:MAG: MotA/TolQ/ExbB proton channel family protein [Verrucomicrobia bacterium]|nr:MotA/TolQ/ExbB proton channel family protein [Verrucomicrobiota bacterium]MBI3866954.1 MotA/TolQ/ExbB proton channel family protein [Verrucomicrobiota bacterium]
MELIFLLSLFGASVLGVTIIIERGISLQRDKVIPTAVMRAIEKSGLGELRAICQRYPSTLSRLLLVASDHLDWPRAQAVELVQTRARHEISKLERNLFILEILVGVAPLLGLVGTVYGLIELFGAMKGAGGSDNMDFAHGISLALRATFGGLIIAIPSLIAWSIYSRRVETFTVEMETLCDEFLRRNHQSGERNVR